MRLGGWNVSVPCLGMDSPWPRFVPVLLHPGLRRTAIPVSIGRMSQETATDPNEVIVCRVTTWYYRRMGLLAAMLLGMGLYFFYDGKVGYPKDNMIAAKKAWFEDTVMKEYDVAKSQGEIMLGEWVKKAREKGWIVKSTTDSPRWDDYAAPYGWDSNPKKHSPEEIEQQFYWGGAMILGAAVAGLLVLINHRKTLVGHPDHMILPNGGTVRFADVFKVDKRKWDNKGLAYAHHREGEGSPARRATIDDLMYGGAGKVLERLLSQFSGELIEKVPEDEEPAAEAPETSGNAPREGA